MYTLILMLMVWNGSARSTSIDHIEFQSKQACEVAEAVINQHEGETWRDYTLMVCVPKG